MSRFDWALRAALEWLASACLLAFLCEAWGAEWPPRSSPVLAAAVVGYVVAALLFGLSVAAAVLLSVLALSSKPEPSRE